MQVSARWHLFPDDYCDRFSYRELRLHFGAFLKQDMAPMAPILSSFEAMAGGDDDAEEEPAAESSTVAKRTATRKPRRSRRGQVKGMPPGWREKPNRAYTYIPHDADPGAMMIYTAQHKLDRFRAPEGVMPAQVAHG